MPNNTTTKSIAVAQQTDVIFLEPLTIENDSIWLVREAVDGLFEPAS
jgi:hypothetical protein